MPIVHKARDSDSTTRSPVAGRRCGGGRVGRLIVIVQFIHGSVETRGRKLAVYCTRRPRTQPWCVLRLRRHPTETFEHSGTSWRVSHSRQFLSVWRWWRVLLVLSSTQKAMPFTVHCTSDTPCSAAAPPSHVGVSFVGWPLHSESLGSIIACLRALEYSLFVLSIPTLILLSPSVP